MVKNSFFLLQTCAMRSYVVKTEMAAEVFLFLKTKKHLTTARLLRMSAIFASENSSWSLKKTFSLFFLHIRAVLGLGPN